MRWIGSDLTSPQCALKYDNPHLPKPVVRLRAKPPLGGGGGWWGACAGGELAAALSLFAQTVVVVDVDNEALPARHPQDTVTAV